LADQQADEKCMPAPADDLDNGASARSDSRERSEDANRGWKGWLKDRIDHSKHADWVLTVASFAETIIVPIPLELVLIPYMIRRRARIWWTATVVLAGCLAAAMLGYAIGALFMQSIGGWAIESFGWREDFDSFRAWFERSGFFAIVAVGVAPIPFQVAMLTAGTTGYSIPLFLAAAILARGVRYYGLALLVHFFGDQALDLWRTDANRAGYAVLVVVLLVVAAAWFLH
jgi:membrane protein YqaA with SNARE-associated domain